MFLDYFKAVFDIAVEEAALHALADANMIVGSILSGCILWTRACIFQIRALNLGRNDDVTLDKKVTFLVTILQGTSGICRGPEVSVFFVYPAWPGGCAIIFQAVTGGCAIIFQAVTDNC